MAALAVPLVFCMWTRAADLHVPAAYPTIQSAIAAASEGDSVIVAPGTYVENINFLGKAITVQSSDPGDPAVVQATIIDGNGGVCVTFKTREKKRSVLKGFTITNGSRGVLCDITPASYKDPPCPTIMGNRFLRNSGHAVRAEHGSPDVIGNTCIDNVYGIAVRDAAYADCIVSGNVMVDCGIWARVEMSGFYSMPFAIVVVNNLITGGGISIDNVGIPSTYSVTVANNAVSGRGINVDTEGSMPQVTIDGNSLYACQVNVRNYGDTAIVNNSVWDCPGSGITCHGGMLVSDNVIEGCTISTSSEGGALVCGGRGVVERNVIRNNSAPSGNVNYTGGGGITAGGALTIRNNLITGNTGYVGGGIYASGGKVGIHVLGNVICHNTSVEDGGGIYLEDRAIIKGNLFAGNYASGFGGGIRGWGGWGKELLLVSNTIVGNGAGRGCGAMYLGDFAGGEGSALLTNSVVRGNNPQTCCVSWIPIRVDSNNIEDGVNSLIHSGEGLIVGNSNIDSDPMCVDGGYWWGDEYVLGGDYRLLPGSPCIDAGTNDVDNPDTPDIETLPPTDLAGVKRIIDGDFSGTATVDIGAYEFLPGDADGDGRVNLLDLLRIRNSLGMEPWSALRRADVNADGRIDLLDLLLTRRLFAGW